MHYAAVLLDLDDTLIPETPAIEAGFAAVAERVWGSSSPARVRSLWSAASQMLREHAPDPCYLAKVHIGASDLLHGSLLATGPEAARLRAFLPYYLDHAFDPVLPETARPLTRELIDLWRATRLSALTVYPDTVEVLTWLGGEVPLALVTNGLSTLQRDKVGVTGLAGFFASVIVAEEAGAGKPDPRMFHDTLHRLRLDANAAVMVGNDSARDIEGARRAGVAAIQIVRREGDRGEVDRGEADRGEADHGEGDLSPDVITDLWELGSRLGLATPCGRG